MGSTRADSSEPFEEFLLLRRRKVSEVHVKLGILTSLPVESTFRLCELKEFVC